MTYDVLITGMKEGNTGNTNLYYERFEDEKTARGAVQEFFEDTIQMQKYKLDGFIKTSSSIGIAPSDRVILKMFEQPL